MIIYEPNRNWLQDISHLAKSWTMQKILRAVLLMGAVSTVMAVVDIELLTDMEMKVNTGIFSLLGVALSILLVFRTNSAYDRWWEGRKQWGALVNNCRNIALMAHVMLPEKETASRHYLAKSLANFCIALKEHLRKGTKLEELIHVSPDELAYYKTLGHIPNQISLEIFQRVEAHYRAGDLSEADMINIKPQLTSLLDILGACERIKKTPIPFSYNVYLKLYITIYGLILPLGLIPEFGYWSIPLVMFVFFAMIGVEMMAEEIEDPFGLDCNDLPTGNIAHTIKNNVFEILESKSSLAHQHQRELYDKIF
ncbi:MAG: bestrophin family protein [Salibacteraceae bacterium]